MTDNTRGSKKLPVKRKWGGSNGGGIADWAGIDPVVIRGAIAAVAKSGGAIRFGYTSDGGAYAVGILGDGEPYTVFIPPSDDVKGKLEDLIEAYG